MASAINLQFSDFIIDGNAEITGTIPLTASTFTYSGRYENGIYVGGTPPLWQPQDYFRTAPIASESFETAPGTSVILTNDFPNDLDALNLTGTFSVTTVFGPWTQLGPNNYTARGTHTLNLADSEISQLSGGGATGHFGLAFSGLTSGADILSRSIAELLSTTQYTVSFQVGVGTFNGTAAAENLFVGSRLSGTGHSDINGGGGLDFIQFNGLGFGSSQTARFVYDTLSDLTGPSVPAPWGDTNGFMQTTEILNVGLPMDAAWDAAKLDFSGFAAGALYRGSDAFSATGRAEMRLSTSVDYDTGALGSGSQLQFDTNGDGTIDARIDLIGVTALHETRSGQGTSSGVFTLRASTTPNVTITGTEAADTINPARSVTGQPKPGAGNDVIFGLGGNDRIDGGAGDDWIDGGEANDILAGGQGADTILGGAGNDRLDGGLGADSMIGGSGNDTYTVDNAGDVVDETNGAGGNAGGTDLVNASISFALTGLAGFVENLTLTGSAAINGTGNDLVNKITGNSGANVLSGGGGNDNLIGNAGQDRLIGGAGNDALNGGLDADIFVFERAGLTNGVDRIADFVSGLDKLEVRASDYLGLSVAGLTAGQLTFGTVAVGAGAQFVYNSARGQLAWDADGAGGTASTQIATLKVGAILTASDFLIV